MAGGIAAKTSHFALHRLKLNRETASVGADPAPDGRVGDWLGAVVPKRWAKRAVTRNMIKRQIFTLMVQTRTLSEVDRQSPAAGVAYVVRLRSEFDKNHFKSASSDLLKAAVRGELTALAAVVSGATT